MIGHSSIRIWMVAVGALGLVGALALPQHALAVSPSEVQLCHIPDNIFCSPNPPRDTRRTCNYETIFVAPRSVQRHLDHGDFLGPCDPDNDGIRSNIDNCPTKPNANQANADGDAAGDACDNCPLLASANQTDGDSDGVGNVCDNCPTVANANQADSDGDKVGTVCDNCPTTANANQANTDGDSRGNACDGCAADPSKITPGVCGCGVPDVDADADGAFACAGDCNDSDRNIFPPSPTGPPRFDAPCDGVDIDCSDGLGGCERRTAACCTTTDCGPIADGCGGTVVCGGPDNDGDGFRPCNGDCNDNNRDIFPTTPAGGPRFDAPCDGIDIDCTDGLGGCERRTPDCCGTADCGPVSDGCGGTVSCPGTDNDGDGFRSCAGDCNDNDSDIHPNPPGTARFDLPCDGKDIDCSEHGNGCEPLIGLCCGRDGIPGCGPVPSCGSTLMCGMDADGDGYPAPCLDCDDDASDDDPANSRSFARNIHPGSGIIDQACDGIDQNCDEPGGCERYCREFECDLPGGQSKCGEVSDGCGGTYQCGSCGVLQNCVNNQCCTAVAPGICDSDISLGDPLVGLCGFVNNQCGAVLDCGQCRPGGTCNGICVPAPGQPPCVPNCTNKTCGEPDGCGGKCTACPAGMACTGLQCAFHCDSVECGYCHLGELPPPFAGLLTTIKSCPEQEECQSLGARICLNPAGCDDDDDVSIPGLCRRRTVVSLGCANVVCPAFETCVVQGGAPVCRCCSGAGTTLESCRDCDDANQVCSLSPFSGAERCCTITNQLCL